MTRNITTRRILAVFGLATLLSACGADTTELEAAQVQASDAAALAADLQAEIETKDKAIADLEAELEAAEGLIETEAATAADLQTTIDGLERDLATAEEEVESIRVRFDPEIRAAAQASWDAEFVRACDEAGNGSASISTYVDYSEEMSAVGTEAQLIEAVTACAEPLRNRSEAERLDAECSPGDVDALIRDTDAFTGDCLVMHVIPWQWDSRTGECTFLGSWDPNNLGVRYSYKYDGDGIFRADDSVCSDGLADADQDDLLKVWVSVIGTFRYDTAAGGTNEIPDFLLRRVELVAKG